MRFFSSKHIISASVVLIVAVPLVLAGVSSIKVANPPPAFENSLGEPTEPSDGGLDKLNPLNFGDTVTFTALATDPNGDSYYLALCRTNSITPQDTAKPICKDGEWGISELTKNGEQASVTYTVGKDAKLKSEWFAFVCDNVAADSNCSKASQGSGDNGSPFYVSKQVGALRFGADCPDIKDIQDINAPQGPAEPSPAANILNKELSKKEIKDLISGELLKKEDEGLSPELKIIKDRIDALKAIEKDKGAVSDAEINAVADYFSGRQAKLKNLAAHNVGFCVTSTDDDSIQNITGETGKTAKPQTEYKIGKETLKLGFKTDEERSISMEFRQTKGQKKPDPADIKGPEITYQDPDQKNKFLNPTDLAKKQAEETGDTPDIFQTVTLKHETYVPPVKEPGFFEKLLGVGQTPPAPIEPPKQVSYVLSSLETEKTDGVTVDETVYQSSDNRKTDIYQYKNDPTSVVSNQIENYTLYHYGKGDEIELYSFDKAVLRMRDDGVIEGYYMDNIDLSKQQGADQVGQDLLARAAATMQHEQILDLHSNGKPQPDFTIPVPIAVDNAGNVIDNLTYEIIGDNFNKLKIAFSADPNAYPIVLDPALQFTAPGSSNLSKTLDSVSAGSFGTSVVTGDFNTDGKIDLAVGSNTYNSNAGRTYIFYNNTTATTTAGADVIIEGQSSSYFGFSLAAGDINVDGKTDLIVGAIAYSSNTGRVYVFYNDGTNNFGTATCSGTPSSCSAANADVIITGEASSGLARSLAVGDFNADGKIDLAAGGELYNTEQGRAYIFINGSSSFPTCTTSCTAASNANVTITGETGSYWDFGWSMAAGDLNADGKTDLAIGANRADSDKGKVYIFLNDGSYPAGAGSAEVIITGTATFNGLGRSLATGDLNADGKTDLAIGAFYSGSLSNTYIFYGRTSWSATYAASSADVTITGESTTTLFGSSVVTGDFNADGRTDLAVGAYGYTSLTGRAYVFYNDGSIPTTAATADIIITGETTNNYFGYSLAAGDFNADGATDLIVGALNYSSNGRAYIFYGGGGLEFRNTITGDSGTVFGNYMTTGDFNADGKTDLAVTAYGYSSNTGRTYIFYNDGSIPTATSSADVTITGEATGSCFGIGLTAGDFDADGKTDLVVGAHYYSSGNGKAYIFYNDGAYPSGAGSADVIITGETLYSFFGAAFTAGDFNADGKTDLAVGAYQYNSSAGRVYLFYNDGSYPSGAGSADVIISGEANSRFGEALTAGDFDADSRTDLAVGAYYYNSNYTGRAYIFYNDGSIPTAASSADVTITGEAVSNGFGISLTSGDFDADGKTDLAVGADSYSSQTGRAYIFYNDGSYPSGAGSAEVIITGEASQTSYFGNFLTSGDFNADGKTDLAVGAFNYNNAFASYGRTYIFYNDGSIPTTAATADIIIDGTMGDQSGGSLAVGDINADGVTDLVIGAHGQSRVYIFYGENKFAWNTKYPWRYENNPGQFFGNSHQIEGWAASEKFGSSITAGDFNGDGAKDLAVGAPGYDSSRGAVYLFLQQGNYPMNDYSATVKITGDAIGDEFGYALASGRIGQTADAVDDLVIGAPGANTNQGYVYIFDGRASWSATYTASNYTNRMADSAANSRCGTAIVAGYDFIGDSKKDFVYSCPGSLGNNGYYIDVCNNDGTYPTDSACETRLPTTTANKGFSLAAGNLNSDVYTDLVLGDPYTSSSTGAVYIYYGDTNRSTGITTSGSTTISGESAGNQFGYSLAIGELSDTRDSKDDVVASAPYYNSNQGKVYIFYNDGSYPSSAGSAEKSFTGSGTYNYGQGLAIGDLNRDGRKDLLIAEPNYSTGRGALYTCYNDNSMSCSDATLMPNIDANSYFGASLLATDVDGNGWDDLIGGAYGYGTNKGLVIINDVNDFGFAGSSSTAYGSGLAVGDFNGDGYKDFAIGSSGYDSSDSDDDNKGRVYIFLKSPTNITKTLTPSADVTITGAAGEQFGFSLSAGKVSDTQDTIDDLVIGVPGYNSNQGRVYEFDGRTTWLSGYNSSDATNTITYSGGGSCGYSVLVGKFQGGSQPYRGRDHIAYGCPDYSSGFVFFVWNDGSLGTQTWTGYDDYFYESSGSPLKCGSSLAKGDFSNPKDGTIDIATGCPAAPYVLIAYNDGDYGGYQDVAIGGSSGTKFGTSVAGGDFNADGTDDIVAGAPEYSTNYGRVYIFNNDGSWGTQSCTTVCYATYADTIITGTSGYYFGQALAGADINNDSKTDLLVGAENSIPNGFIYAYYNDGSIPTSYSNYDMYYPSLYATYSSTTPRQIAIGDLNFDGKQDILTSAPGYSSSTGWAHYIPSVNAQCEPSYITSAVISGTSGFTNSATPTISLYYTNSTGSAIVPTQAYLSCDGTNWGSPVTVSGSSSPVTENTFDITSPTPMGCTTANGSKTIYARLNTSCGVRIGYSASGSINYDDTPPTISGFTASVVSADQISLDPTASDSGSGMHATPYWYTETPGASCSHTNTYGWTATDPYTWGSLSANTQYSFDVKARDLLTNESSYSTCRTLYSGAYTPSAPTLTEPTSSTVKVNPVSGGTPAEKDMAIYESNSDSNCLNGTGGQYVQADGSLGGSPVWQADGSWGTGGTITVTGLTSGNTYYFCVKARNNDNVETVFGASSSVLLNTAPTFSEGPSDNGSSETSPTTAGNDVTFTAKSSDPDSNNYYLAICKTDSITPHDNAPPTCASAQTWAISGETTYGNGNTASVAYTTSSGNDSTNIWYAFLCDKVAGGTAACSSPGSQGSGNNGSPFVVNHQAVLGTVKIGSECGDTAPTGPGNAKTMKITNGVWTGTDTGYGSAIQSDGKIVVVGASNNGTNYDFAIVRYLANGSLDTSFGSGGKVTTPIGSGNDTALSVAIQSDGKIVVAGYSNNGSNDDIAVVRYTAAGALDTGFSSDGIVTTPIGAGTDWAYSVLIQSDDKIVVAGFSNNGSNDDIAVVRYTAAGALDTDFSSDGIVTTDIGGDLDRGLEAAIQSDGKIVVGGVSKSGSYTDFAVVRYNTNGTLDTDFDGDVGMPGYPGNGKVTTDIASNDDSASEIGIQSDGKIVLGGSTYNGTDFDFAAVRYNTNGTLDTSFDSDGKVTTPIGSSHDQSTTLVIQNDGKIVLGGGSYNGGYYDFALVRYNSNGTLDSNFDSDGKVTTQLSATTDSISYIRLQTDSKIVAAGYTAFGSNTDFAVVRYNINGSLDATFDHDGKVTSQVWSVGDDGRASAIQSDGKLVVAGYTSNGTNDDFLVARYNVDGSLDTSFSDDGLVTTPVLSSNDEAYAVAIQSDGKIVVGGTTDNGGNNDFAVVRYNTNGSLDTDFDTDGIVTTPVGTGYDWLGDIAIQSDGNIVAAGSATSSGNMDIAVVRYNTDGSLDTTFSGDGKVTTAIGSGLDGGESVAIQSDGKIVVAGEASMPVSGDDFAVVRYNTDGSLDTSFDSDGKVTTTIGVSSDQGKDVAIQSDGKIVVAGWYYSGPTNYGDTAVVRYNTNGSLDTSFDGDGKATTTIFSGKDDFGYSVVIQSDGKIVVAGETDRISGSGRDFSLVRFTSAGALDTTFDSDGKVTTSVGSGLDQCRSIAVQSDGRIVAIGRTNNGSNYDLAVVRYNTNGSVDSPSGYACAQSAVTDSDSDTVDIYVCSTDVFSGACETGETLCTITGVRSGFSGQCIMNGSVPVPTAHGSYNAYVFIVDQHGYQGSGTSTQTYSVADVAPALTSYTLTHSPTLAAGGSDTVDYYLDLSDANGYADVTNVKGVFFDSSSVNNYCTLNDNNCYIHSSCTPSNQSGASLRATCQSTVWFNSNASTVWKVQAKPTTDLGVSDLPNLSDADNKTIPALLGIDIVQSSIGYGTIAIGGTSVAIETSIGNAGNQRIDVRVDGDNMCIDSYQSTCPTSDYVPLSQQKWYHTSDPFDWDDPDTGPGPYTLVDTASGTGDATGCLNRNIDVRSDHASTSTNESIYWKLRILSLLKAGSYYGRNTFAAATESVCSTGVPY